MCERAVHLKPDTYSARRAVPQLRSWVALRCFGNQCVARSSRYSPKRRDFRQTMKRIFATSTKSIEPMLTTRCPLKATPSRLPHSLNQGRRDGVAFNGQRVVSIGSIDFVDVAKIRFIVCRKSRRFGEYREDLATHRFPKHLNATHDWSGGTARAAEYVSGFKWTAFSHIVSRALHRAENLVREVAAPGLAEGFGEITGFRRMAAV